MIGGSNLFLGLSGDRFRTYVHLFAVITDAARRAGLELTARERRGPIWENAVFERSREPALGGHSGMPARRTVVSPEPGAVRSPGPPAGED